MREQIFALYMKNCQIFNTAGTQGDKENCMKEINIQTDEFKPHVQSYIHLTTDLPI